MAVFLARALGASEAEVAAAIDAVGAALAADVMRRAAAVRECRREMALAVTLDDGTLVEGVADLAFLEAKDAGVSSWMVVDFKTDVEISGRLDEYRGQLAIYLRAIERATGLPARGILLRI
jgi:hypothetical protein